jgi:hypothetical protein
MPIEKKFSDVRLSMLEHIRDEFLDMTDPGDLSDKDLFELDNSMSELARSVLHILGIEIIKVDGDIITAEMKLQSTETLEL